MESTYSVIVKRAFSDNYIYVWQYAKGLVVAVDPGDEEVVLDVLHKHSLKLTDIFVTHGHFDHTGGIKKLKNTSGCRVIGPYDRMSTVNHIVGDGQIVKVAENNVKIIHTPGHTDTSVCFYVPSRNKEEQPILFTGDTLFVGGCGRIFGSGVQTMWNSLKKLTELPEQTLVYPGHDYTVENYEFALTIEPNNDVVKKRLQEVKLLIGKGLPTVPSTIREEKQTNIFLRADNPQVKKALKMPNAKTHEVFAELRRRKDYF